MAVAAGLVMIGAGISGSGTAPVGTLTGTSMNGKKVFLDPGVAHLPATSPGATTSIGKLSVPSVGLSVPLYTLRETHGQITPPGFRSAYKIANLGVPLSDAKGGTVFVAMHSLGDGAIGPGNYLIDADKGTARVSTGALVEVNGADYRVTGWSRIDKGDLPYSSSVWSNTPRRLVMITCLVLPNGDPSADNIVITAQLASPEP